MLSPGGLMRGPGMLYEFSLGLQICQVLEHDPNDRPNHWPSSQITVYYQNNIWSFEENTSIEAVWENITPRLLDLGVVCIPMIHTTVEKVTLPELNLDM